MQSSKTDWDSVANWYHQHLTEGSTYQQRIIFPKVHQLLNPQAGQDYLDVACGEGAFIAGVQQHSATSHWTGIDASAKLIELARQRHIPQADFIVTPAQKLPSKIKGPFAGATCILALQNITDLLGTCQAVQTVLNPGANFIMVLNHPAFRIPKLTSWGWDPKQRSQYRRSDGYMTPQRFPIQAHPGSDPTTTTWSFHRPLSIYINTLNQAGFAVTQLEEWVSDKTSQAGPRANAENKIRQEIPLFLMLKAQKL